MPTQRDRHAGPGEDADGMSGLAILSGYLVSVDYLTPLISVLIGWSLGALAGLLSRRTRE
jgi:hypothetical protein